MMGYIIKSTICLGIVLLVYLLALEREKMHRFNRVYLLLGLILSLIIPFLPSGEVIYQAYNPIIFNDGSDIVIPESVADGFRTTRPRTVQQSSIFTGEA